MKTFEEKLKRLEAINNQIKGGDIHLETSLKLFEEGISLAKKLEKELSKAERKVEYLMEDSESSSEEDASDEDASDEDASDEDASDEDSKEVSEEATNKPETKTGGGRRKKEISSTDDDRNLKLFEDDEVSKNPSTGDKDHE